MRAVIWTDVFQSAVMTFGMMAIVIQVCYVELIDHFAKIFFKYTHTYILNKFYYEFV